MIHLLLNILFALLAGVLTWWATTAFGAPRQVAVILTIVVGVLVFLGDLAP